MRRVLVAVLSCAAVVLTASSSGSVQQQPSAGLAAQPPRGAQVAFWAGEEGLGFDGIDPATPAGYKSYWLPRDTRRMTPAVWALLAKHRVPLYINLKYQRDFGPLPPGIKTPPADGLALVRKANQLGIPVSAWLVVPFGDGYWAHEGNAATNRAALAAFHEWADVNRLVFRGVSFDSEPSIQLTREIEADPLGRILSPTHKTLDPARQCRSINAYRGLVSDAAALKRHISAAAYPMVLDDYTDGLMAFQDALEVVTVPPGWDEVHFMVYRTVTADIFRTDPGSGLIASYAKSARERLGDAGRISLGVTGTGVYSDLDNIVDDVRVLATLNMGETPLYSLETTLAAFGVAGVERLVKAGSQPYEGLEAMTMTSDTPQSLAIRAFWAGVDVKLAAATLTSTAGGAGGPQRPLAFPDGCPADVGGEAGRPPNAVPARPADPRPTREAATTADGTAAARTLPVTGSGSPLLAGGLLGVGALLHRARRRQCRLSTR